MKKAILALLLLLMSGCSAPRYLIDTKVDHFDGYTLNRMYGNWIDASGDGDLRFNVQKYTAKDNIVYFSIIIHMSLMKDWFFIEQGESLILLIDGIRVGFSGEGSISHRTTGHLLNNVFVEEMAFYDVSLDQLRAIASAKKVEVKVRGSNISRQGSFTADNFLNLRRFLSKFAKDL